MKAYSFRGKDFHKILMAAVAVLTFFASASASRAQSVTIALSAVANPGNAPDPSTGYGEVDYTFDIGTYDVTLTQYAAFLNAVAGADPYDLYSPYLATAGNYSGLSTNAGIVQSGSPGEYSYSVIGNSGNDPVTYVSWLDAARFCNWLQNGEPAGVEGPGTTETGAYTLDGDTTVGMETKNAGATWWIPSEDEWYKAAYYDPLMNGGSGGYWSYATQSNAAPGNVVGSGSNEANYYTGVYPVTQSAAYASGTNYLTPVGAFTNSASYYGTYDQNGDVFQWNDALIADNYRGLRGGYWNASSGNLQSSDRDFAAAADDYSFIGFRVASVPEPGQIPLILVGIAALALIHRKPRNQPT